MPAVQGVRQPGEGAQVRHSSRRAAKGTRLVLRSRLTEEGRLSFAVYKINQLFNRVHNCQRTNE